MTANDIFNSAMTLMFGESRDVMDYQPFFLPTLNILLAENFEINNGIRISLGKEPLVQFPKIENMSDEIPYEEIFSRVILPYGCAGNIYTDDDRGLGSEYKNKYEYERNRIITGYYTEAQDVYQ